jgi:hypothetical protein
LAAVQKVEVPVSSLGECDCARQRRTTAGRRLRWTSWTSMVVLRGRVVVMEDDHEDLEINWNIHVDMRGGVPGCSGRLCPRRCTTFSQDGHSEGVPHPHRQEPSGATSTRGIYIRPSRLIGLGSRASSMWQRSPRCSRPLNFGR